MNMRTDGLIEFKGHLINPDFGVNGVSGTVVWSLEKINISGPQNVNRISAQILKEWRESNEV